MENFVTIAKNILLADLPHDGVFINYTMTGGNDTLYMAKFVSEGNVLAFTEDIDAVDNAMALFEGAFQDNVHVIQDNPLNVEKYITSKINGFILNPVKGAMPDADVKALLKVSMNIMKKGARAGILLSSNYVESIAYLASLPREMMTVLHFSLFNDDTPEVYIVEKTI